MNLYSLVNQATQITSCLLQKLMLRKRTIASGVLAPMGDSLSDVGELVAGVSCDDDELSVPATITELRVWAQERFKDAGGQIGVSDGTANSTLLVFRDNHESHQAVIARASQLHPNAERMVVLSPDTTPHLHTHHLESGMAVTELAGSMLGLWPAATLEAGNNTALFVD